MRLKTLHLLFFTLAGFSALSQIPSNYYDQAEGKHGYTLKTALYDIIKGHTDRGYGALWDVYKTSDRKPNGKVWDMYSDVPGGTPAYEYTFVDDQCGNYSGEGSCYNREHSMPKSWFNDASPMTNDPFHIVPSDGYVNGRRGNYPFGEVGSVSWESTNGSKLGSNSLAGYSGTVFEPIDEYKGDFARGYFYMATRYENVVASWENNNANGDAMLDGSSDQVFEDWALEMLLDWHYNDPVSQKELDRNDAIYDFQGNRNPFIDHPEWVGCIWEQSCDGSSTNLVTSVNSISFEPLTFGDAAVTKTFLLEGEDLESDVALSLEDENISLALDESETFVQNLSITPSSGVISVTVRVRFQPMQNANVSIADQLQIEYDGNSSASIPISAEILKYEESIPLVNYEFSEVTATEDQSEYNIYVYTSEKLEESLTIHSTISNLINIEYGNEFVTTPSFTQNTITNTIAAGDSVTSFAVSLDWSRLQSADDKSFTLELSENPSYVVGIVNELNFIIQGLAVPELLTSTSLLNLGSVVFGEEAIKSSFFIEASGLSEAVSVSISNPNFAISLNEFSNYKEELTVGVSENGTVTEEVFVRFDPIVNENGPQNDVLSLSSAELGITEVHLEGVVVENQQGMDTVSFVTDTLFVNLEEPVMSAQIQTNIKVENSLQFSIQLTDFKDIFYPLQFETDPVADGTTISHRIEEGDSIANIELRFLTDKLTGITNRYFTLKIASEDRYALGVNPTTVVAILSEDDAVTGIVDKKEYTIQVFPNPVDKQLSIQSELVFENYLMYSFNGVLVQKGHLESNMISLQDIPPGLYYVRLISESSDQYLVKVLKK